MLLKKKTQSTLHREEIQLIPFEQARGDSGEKKVSEVLSFFVHVKGREISEAQSAQPKGADLFPKRLDSWNFS